MRLNTDLELRVLAELEVGPGSAGEIACAVARRPHHISEVLETLLERGDVKRVPYKWITPSGLTVEKTGYIYMIPEHAEAWGRRRKA